jgi:hypothetical protein
VCVYYDDCNMGDIIEGFFSRGKTHRFREFSAQIKKT